MTLEEWRKAAGLSYQALAERFGLSSATHARRYALGKVEVPPEKKEEIIAGSGGLVTLHDFHLQRLAEARRGTPTLAPAAPGENDNPAAESLTPEECGA